MPPSSSMPVPQRIVQACLFLVAAIALFGGTVQMLLGQPETTPRLDIIAAARWAVHPQEPVAA